MTSTEQGKPFDRGSALEVLWVFLRLGLSSFGGPIAHIGYFRDEFVTRRRWLDEQAYADLVALCQFLPGPASSQVGFSIGLMRAGYLGGLAAWTGFTLPSAHRAPAVCLRRRLAWRTDRHGPASRAEARGGRDRRAGGMGHGAHRSAPTASVLRSPPWPR